jgi:hypothetical protein
VSVTLMLAWFDEPEELLHQCVTSAAVIADRIVAADGAYEQVADKRATSPASQRQAIERAAYSAGITIDFLPAKIWKGQLEKRNALLKAATAGFGTGDFVMPLDSDWVLHGSREAVRHELAQGYVEEFRVWFHQTINPERPLLTAPHDWHRSYNGQSKREPLLFRALYKMKLEKTHWHYSGCRKGGKRIGLSGGWKLGYARPVSKELQAPFWIEHRAMFRDDKQLERNRLFCAVRDEERERVGFER